MVYIPSNVSAEEYFKHFCTDENAKRFYAEGIEEVEEEIDKSANYEKENELLREQIYFATELIGELEHRLNQTARMSEFRKIFKTALANSLFER